LSVSFYKKPSFITSSGTICNKAARVDMQEKAIETQKTQEPIFSDFETSRLCILSFPDSKKFYILYKNNRLLLLSTGRQEKGMKEKIVNIFLKLFPFVALQPRL